MKNLDPKLSQIIYRFCEQFNLSKPTNNLVLWWLLETKKMDLDTLNLCLEAFGRTNIGICNQMCIVLKVRIQEILAEKKYVLYVKGALAVWHIYK